ncbi:MAG: phosphate/phosphite/phosphonate ABC transporter substrate-binding protein [Gammaproteobacteria bacterium]|nr:phosphate/phosphite/phosphonate ABC transporter substrate-binding protein [Gammaproteobacteria bacterium]
MAMLMMNTATIAAEHYTFGIVPQASGSKLAQQWVPVLAYLQEKTGYKLEFATARNIPSYEQRLLDGKYDLAYMNPYHYTKYSATSGYRAFAKAKDARLQGILVVRKDSSYRELKDLAKQEIAFPSNAFAANQIPRSYFNNNKIEFTPRYVSSHDSVYRNVAKGRFAAGGGVMRTFNNTAAEFRDNLRVLWTSDSFSPHAFAALPRVPADVVKRIQKAMLDMAADPRGRVLLEGISFKAIEAAQDSEYNDLRALHVVE